MSWFDSPAEILTVLSIAGVVVGVLFWIIDSRLNKVLKEFRPNGGTSVRDQLNRIEGKIDGHIDWHMHQR